MNVHQWRKQIAEMSDNELLTLIQNNENIKTEENSVITTSKDTVPFGFISTKQAESLHELLKIPRRLIKIYGLLHRKSMNVKDTSLEAYRGIKPKLSKTQEEVLEFIRKYPGSTQYNVSQCLGENHRKRISELLGPDGTGYIIEVEPLRIRSSPGRLKTYTRYRVNTNRVEKL
jgi:hypothetical protein